VQAITGSLGYLGNRGSVNASRQSTKVDPRVELMSSEWRQVAQRPFKGNPVAPLEG